MILVTGDTHGGHDGYKLSALKRRSSRNGVNVDHLIIAGDFGYIFDDTPDNSISGIELHQMNGVFEKAPWCTWFVPGNHENYDILDSLPRIVKNGARCIEFIKDKLYMVDRGEILTLEGKTFLCIGGAESVDKQWRLGLDHKCWWEQELITEEDIANARHNLAKYDNKVDYVITHTCPQEVLNEVDWYLPPWQADMWGEKHDDPSAMYLSEIRKDITFKAWYFGHFHEDAKLTLKDKGHPERFFMLYHSMEEIPE